MRMTKRFLKEHIGLLTNSPSKGVIVEITWKRGRWILYFKGRRTPFVLCNEDGYDFIGILIMFFNYWIGNNYIDEYLDNDRIDEDNYIYDYTDLKDSVKKYNVELDYLGPTKAGTMYRFIKLQENENESK